jgi:hypothetical protein
MKRPPLIYLEIYDHGSGNDGWMSAGEVETNGIMHQVAIGWLVKEDKYHLVLTPWLNTTDNQSAVRIYIVRSAIIKRRRLTAPR